MALPLMPISLVVSAFDELFDSLLQGKLSNNAQLKLLFDYFENQWLKNVDLKLWNVYELEMRTNNNAEGFCLY